MTPARANPLVAVVYTVPLLVEALRGALDGVGELRAFPARSGALAELLDHVRPDAVVVDSDEEAGIAAWYAQDASAAVVHLDLHAHTVRVFDGEEWSERDATDTAPERIRNLLAGALYGRRPA